MTRNALAKLILKWHRKPSTFPVDMWGVKLKQGQDQVLDTLFDTARPKAKKRVARKTKTRLKKHAARPEAGRKPVRAKAAKRGKILRVPRRARLRKSA